ncbi:hypothetical protein MNBD_GAMMA06-244 [hydrothermal vent metagenome]|uniref:STAS domain-containing protein n=1 Tax=hydrothermal vent metagenome TaxID=652676 RepID=A0A3B0XC66_9ZZZZ
MQLSQAEITQHNSKQSSQQLSQQYLISGVVDFSTVPGLLRQAKIFCAAEKTSDDKKMVIDLSQVEECNSAALALMLEIIKSAQQNNVSIHFKNLPSTLLTIAKAYGIEDEIREFCQ